MMTFEAFLARHISGTDRRHVAKRKPATFASAALIRL